MEYQKIANLIDDNTLNQPSKFRTRNWIEINDESRGAYNVNSQIKFKTTMLKSSLCDYSDAYILVKGTITVNNTAAAVNNTNKKVIFKNCAPFTNCISEINNTQIDNAKDIDIVMPMYNLIEYSDNYAKTTGSLWQYCKDIPARNANDEIIVFDGNELDKACFVHDAAYSDSKDLTKRTIADKNLKNRAFDITKDPKYDGYQRGLASMVYKFFDSKVSGSGAKLIPENEQLANELHKPIIRKFEKRKVYSTFKDNIWSVDLALIYLELDFYYVLLIFLVNMFGLFL